jgi:hypothetical protein
MILRAHSMKWLERPACVRVDAGLTGIECGRGSGIEGRRRRWGGCAEEAGIAQANYELPMNYYLGTEPRFMGGRNRRSAVPPVCELHSNGLAW